MLSDSLRLIIGKYFSSTRSWLTTTTWSVDERAQLGMPAIRS
jgi:hypothetical protein